MATPSTAPVTNGKTDLKGNGLEDDLRKMILGSVTMANEQSNQTIAQGPHQQHFRGRGRGRGFFRGRGGANFQAQAGRGQHSDGPMTAAAAPHSGMQGSPQQVYNQHAAPSSPTAGGFQAISDRRRAPIAPKQRPPQTGAETTVAPAVQPPRILQRPQAHTNANPSNAPHHTVNTQHYPRQYGPPTQHISRPIENPMAQANYLDQLASEEIPKVEITIPELEEKEAFRNYLEGLCQKALSENSPSDIATISLVGFGSLASGFATPGSDMDLAVVPSWKNPFKAHEIGIDRDIPRLLEKVVLDANMGARLLTRTRVPILKVCQKPDEELYRALSEERQKWDDLPEEEKYAPPPPPPERSPRTPADVDGAKSPSPVHKFQEFPSIEDTEPRAASQQEKLDGTASVNRGKVQSPTKSSAKDSEAKDNKGNGNGNGNTKEQHQRNERPWFREKVRGPLDFPKTGVGIQCDINFENPLGIHNTQLLRCYSRSDPRVRPIVLFVKAWAKQRKINSAYSGTLSSYGWVLMVLHYLVNIAQPPVCPNLQSLWRPPVVSTDMQGLKQMFQNTMIAGYAVRFWRNEDEIMRAASLGQLTQNYESIGMLLRGFFQYYASINSPYTYGPKPPSFYWTNEVLSLRTPGGVRAKSEKGWTSAKTTISNGKEVRHRYLFCIEDPFELDHNVARTVTHKGIVAIRDEFRRTWRILSAVGRGQQPEGGIFDEIVEKVPPPTPKMTETAMEAEQKPIMTGAGVAGGEADGQIDGQHTETKGSALAEPAV